MAGQVWIDMLETRVDKDHLILAYRVTNRSNQSIYLFTPMNDFTESGIVADPNKVYAFLDMHGVLQITKRVWSVPDEVDIYAPLMPNLTPVAPAQSFSERLALPLPVKIDYPYRFAGEDELHVEYDTVTDQSNGVAVSMGHVREQHVARASNEGAADRDDRHVIEYGLACVQQEILQGPIINAKIPLQDAEINT